MIRGQHSNATLSTGHGLALRVSRDEPKTSVLETHSLAPPYDHREACGLVTIFRERARRQRCWREGTA